MWSVGGGYAFYVIMKYSYSFSCIFWQLHRYFLFNLNNCFSPSYFKVCREILDISRANSAHAVKIF